MNVNLGHAFVLLSEEEVSQKTLISPNHINKLSFYFEYMYQCVCILIFSMSALLKQLQIVCFKSIHTQLLIIYNHKQLWKYKMAAKFYFASHFLYVYTINFKIIFLVLPKCSFIVSHIGQLSR